MTPPLDRLRTGLVDGIATFERSRTRRRLLATGGAALAVVVIVGGFFLFRDDPSETVIADNAENTTEPDPAPDQREEPADDPAEEGDALVGEVWTPPRDMLPPDAFFIGDDTVLFWGAFDHFGAVPPVVGLSLDLRTGTFTELPKPPVENPFDRAVAWTGTELIVCCGNGRAQAYDPATSTWRETAVPPGGGSVAGEWTGTELFVVRDGTALEVYDPVQDAWESLPAPTRLASQFPFYATAWAPVTGARAERFFVWPTPPQRTTHSGWVYDLGEGTWTELPPIPIAGAPAIVDVVWAGDRLIVGGGLPAATAGTSERFVLWQLVDGTDEWTQIGIDTGEPQPCECNLGSQTLLWTGNELLVHLGALGSAIDSDGTLWSIDPRTGSDELLATGGHALVPMTRAGPNVVWRTTEGDVIVGPVSLASLRSANPEPTPHAGPAALCALVPQLAEVQAGSGGWNDLVSSLPPFIDDGDVGQGLEDYLLYAGSAPTEGFAGLPSDIVDNLAALDGYLLETCDDHTSFAGQIDASRGAPQREEAVASARLTIPAGTLPAGYEPAPLTQGIRTETHLVSLDSSAVEVAVITLHSPGIDWRDFGAEGDSRRDTYFSIRGNQAVAFEGAEGLFEDEANPGWSVQWGEDGAYGVLVLSPFDLDRTRTAIDLLRFDADGLVSDAGVGLTATPIPSMMTGIWETPEPMGDDVLVVLRPDNPERALGIDLYTGTLDAQSELMAMMSGGVVEIVPVETGGRLREVRLATAGSDDFRIVMAAWQETPDTVVSVWNFTDDIDVIEIARALVVG